VEEADAWLAKLAAGRDVEPPDREWMINFGDSGYVELYRYDGQRA